MEIAVNIISADEDEFRDVGDSAVPLDQWTGIEANGLDTVKLATIHSVVTGDSLHEALDLYEPIYVAEVDEGREILVLQLADDLLERLVELDEDAMEGLAGELAMSEEFEGEQRDPEDVLELLAALSELAQLAEAQGQVLFVWMRLERG